MHVRRRGRGLWIRQPRVDSKRHDKFHTERDFELDRVEFAFFVLGQCLSWLFLTLVQCPDLFHVESIFAGSNGGWNFTVFPP